MLARNHTECNAPTPENPGLLDRLRSALEGGAATLFQDRALLRDLAAALDDDPAAWAAAKAMVRDAKQSARDFERVVKAVAPAPAPEARTAPPPYFIDDDGNTVWNGPQGPVVLARFSARYAEQVVRVDEEEGAVRRLAVEGVLAARRRPLPRVELTAEDLRSPDWPLNAWGPAAVVEAVPRVADHLRAALGHLSGDVPLAKVYSSTGWHDHEGRRVFVHAGGAVDADGPVEGVRVELPESLRRFVLPSPPCGDRLRRAVRADLKLSRLGKNHVAVCLHAAGSRVPLGRADFNVFVHGMTQSFKSSEAVLHQRRFAAGPEAAKATIAFNSTPAAIEATCFHAKDLLALLDDYKAAETQSESQRLAGLADRFFRGAANGVGRDRCDPTGKLIRSRPPRGTFLATGESLPPGQSLQARLLVLERNQGDIRPDELSACQADAAAGLYAESMAGYVRWLARDGGKWPACLAAEQGRLRAEMVGGGVTGRAAEMAGDLLCGWRAFLDYASDAGALSPAESAAERERGRAAIMAAVAGQAEGKEESAPAALFLARLNALPLGGQAHVARQDGGHPTHPATLGWRRFGDEWRPQGVRVGFIDDDTLLLIPEAAYAEVAAFGKRQGQEMPCGPQQLWRSLHKAGKLARVYEQGGKVRFAPRRLIGGGRPSLLHVRRADLDLPGGDADPVEEWEA